MHNLPHMIVLFALIFGLGIKLNGQTMGVDMSHKSFDDSLFTVYPMKLNTSGAIKSVEPVKENEIPFEIPLSFYSDYSAYALIMILKIDAYGHQYFQFELGKGYEMKQRKSILFTAEGRVITFRDHTVKLEY